MYCRNCHSHTVGIEFLSSGNREYGHNGNCNKTIKEQNEEDEIDRKRREQERYERMFPYD